MFRPMFTITNEITSALLEIERARGFLDAADLREDWLEEMQDRAMVREAHHSTHIEGTALSLDQAEGILQGEGMNDVSSDDRQESLN